MLSPGRTVQSGNRSVSREVITEESRSRSLAENSLFTLLEVVLDRK